MASSLFITHIPSILTLTDLGEMFKKDNLTIIQMESLDTPDRALVTCPDQFVADRVIDKYNGRIIHGNRLVVEPWLELLASGAPRRRAPAPVTTVENSGMNPRAKPFVFPLSEAAGTREFIPRSMKEEKMEEDDLTF